MSCGWVLVAAVVCAALLPRAVCQGRDITCDVRKDEENNEAVVTCDYDTMDREHNFVVDFLPDHSKAAQHGVVKCNWDYRRLYCVCKEGYRVPDTETQTPACINRLVFRTDHGLAGQYHCKLVPPSPRKSTACRHRDDTSAGAEKGKHKDDTSAAAEKDEHKEETRPSISEDKSCVCLQYGDITVVTVSSLCNTVMLIGIIISPYIWPLCKKYIINRRRNTRSGHQPQSVGTDRQNHHQQEREAERHPCLEPQQRSDQEPPPNPHAIHSTGNVLEMETPQLVNEELPTNILETGNALETNSGLRQVIL